MSYPRPNRLRFDRWETWAGLVVLGLCVGIGVAFGQRLGHRTFGLLVGVVVGFVGRRLIEVWAGVRRASR